MDVIQVVNETSHPTFFRNDLTTPYGKILCTNSIYGIHIFLAYVLVVSGIGALITRYYKKEYHVVWGRVFLLAMLWCMGSSALIYTTGLPRSILYFFIIMLIAISVGFVAIRVAQFRFAAKILSAADDIQANGDKRKVSDIVAEAKFTLLARPKTWKERFFSLKALHGYCMTLAWYQMAGRAMVTNPVSAHEGCPTYPAWKNPLGIVRLVPEEDIDGAFYGKEVQFAAMASVPAFILIPLIGVAWSVYESRKQKQAQPE